MPLTKAEARKMIKIRLANLDDEDYSARSATVYELASSFLSGHKSANELKNVLLYQASPAWREVDLSGLAPDFPGVRFDSVPIDANARMSDADYDIIFVPLYGFNDDNFRLGHGSGWYDRFLAHESRTLKVGVGFEINRINFETDFYDIAMDKIITDR